MANDVVVCDPTHPQVPNAVTRVEYAVDFPPTPGYLVYVAPTNLDTPERIIYLNTLKAQMDALKTVPKNYWICTDTNPVDGVLDSVREMTQAEKDALDAPNIAAENARVSRIREIKRRGKRLGLSDEEIHQLANDLVVPIPVETEMIPTVTSPIPDCNGSTAKLLYDAATKVYSCGTDVSSADGSDCPAGQYARGIDAGGNASGCTVDQVGSGSGRTYMTLTADRTNNSNPAVFANVTDLSFSVSADTNYDIQCTLAYTSAATTTGANFASTIPSSPSLYIMAADVSSTGTAIIRSTSQANDGGTLVTSSAYATPNLNVAVIHANLRNGSNAGTWQLRFKNEINGSGVVVKAGSFCSYQTY